MPNWELIDDASPQVGYSSGWSVVTGSSRQWNSAVHSTSQSGATATLRFKGVAFQVYVTVPASSSSAIQRATISIDGGAPVTVTRQASSSPQYDMLFFERDGLPEGIHNIVVANGGGGVPLQVDKFEYLPGFGDPNPAPLFPEPTTSTRQVIPTTRPPTPPTTTPTSQITTRNPDPDPSTTTTSTPRPGIIDPSDPNPPDSVRSRSSAGEADANPTEPSSSSGTSNSSESGNSTESGFLTTMTDESGRATVFRIVPSFSERVVTITDSNGNVSTSMTPVGATGGISTGAIVGIVVGCLALVAGVVFVVALLACRRRRKRRAMDQNTQPQGYDPTSPPASRSFAAAMFSGRIRTKQPFTQLQDPTSNPNSPSSADGRSPTDTTVTRYPSMRERDTRRRSWASRDYNISSEGADDSMYAETVNDPPPAYRIRSSAGQSLAVDPSIAVVEGKSSSD